MKRPKVTAVALCLSALAVPDALAGPRLFDYGVNISGTVYTKTTAVPGLAACAFDTTAGLGTLILTYTPAAAGRYYLLSFFDHEIDEPESTFFNEVGAVSSMPAAG